MPMEGYVAARDAGARVLQVGVAVGGPLLRMGLSSPSQPADVVISKRQMMLLPLSLSKCRPSARLLLDVGGWTCRRWSR